MGALLDRLKREFANRGVIVYRHTNASRSERLRFINEVKAERELLLSHVEAEQLINALQASHGIAGDVAEVGTYRGASARLLKRYLAPHKTLHVFDTFAGLPEPGVLDADFRSGQFASSLEEVQHYLGTDNVQYHVGVFPESLNEEFRQLKFSFVHLDVDLYEGTLECLRFFYPRMNAGGVLVSHDFGAERAPGVAKAFSEYFQPLNIPYVQLSGFQAIVVKLSCVPPAS